MQCSKIRHLSEEAASPHITDLARAFGQKSTAYQCKTCGFWHVGGNDGGKMSKKQRRRRKERLARNKNKKRRRH